MLERENQVDHNMAESKVKVTGMLAWLWLSVAVLVLDWVTKSAVTDTMDLYQSIPVFSFFNFTLLHNTGAAFSFLSDAGGWQRWMFSVIAIVTSVALIVWLWKLGKAERWLAIALAFIIGGALGNVYDRIVYGYVIDFLDFHWAGMHFPAFNVADSAISIGAFMMAVDIFRNPAK